MTFIYSQQSFEDKQKFYRYSSKVRDIFDQISKTRSFSENSKKQLNEVLRESGFSEAEMRSLYVTAFKRLVHKMMVKPERADFGVMMCIADRFDFSPEIIDWIDLESGNISFLSMLESQETKAIPIVNRNDCEFAADEEPYVRFYSCFFSMMPESDVLRDAKYTRVARGIDYRIGEERTELIVKNGLLELDNGELIITNQRIILFGSGFPVSTPIEKLFGTRIFADALQFSVIDNSSVFTAWFEDSIAPDYCGLVLSKLLNS